MSSYDESLKITFELVRRHVDDGREIRPSDHIQNDLGLDSLGVMEFVSDVESYFGVNIPSDMFEHIATIEDVARGGAEAGTPPEHDLMRFHRLPLWKRCAAKAANAIVALESSRSIEPSVLERANVFARQDEERLAVDFEELQRSIQIFFGVASGHVHA